MIQSKKEVNEMNRKKEYKNKIYREKGVKRLDKKKDWISKTNKE